MKSALDQNWNPLDSPQSISQIFLNYSRNVAEWVKNNPFLYHNVLTQSLCEEMLKFGHFILSYRLERIGGTLITPNPYIFIHGTSPLPRRRYSPCTIGAFLLCMNVISIMKFFNSLESNKWKRHTYLFWKFQDHWIHFWCQLGIENLGRWICFSMIFTSTS